MKYTAEQVQKTINKIHGPGKIICDCSTFQGIYKKARFVDKDFGEWYTKPFLVLKGHGHPRNSALGYINARKLPLEYVEKEILRVHQGLYLLVPETYTVATDKACFYDKEKKEYFVTKVAYILQGHGNPSRRVDKIRKKNTSHLQALGKQRIKYRGSSGQTIIELCKQYSAPLSVYHQLAQRTSTDFAINTLLSRISKDGTYQKYRSSLEDVFLKLVLPEFKLEKWNKKPLEADISYHPDFRFAVNNIVLYVDVHGLFHHSEYVMKSKHHYNRADIFRKFGLPYLQFFADEIYKKPDIIKSILRSKLGKISERFFARNLHLKRVSPEEARKFLDTNHLMGYKSAPAVGLIDQNQNLISVLSYKKWAGHLEIERFATKLNTTCVGGFGKLVTHLKQFNKPIVSFCDLRYSDGHSYKTLGFKELGTTLGWNWTNGKERFNRLVCTATHNKSERENAAERGLFKIYDAGQRKYRLEVTTEKTS